MMVKNILGVVLWGLICVVVGVNVLFLNVVFHEFGHYLAADHYGLEPEMKFGFDFDRINGGLLSFGGAGLASTSFIDNGNFGNLLVVVLTGPFVNLLLGIFFFFVFVFVRNENVRELLFICAIVSLLSFGMNMLPINGVDGSVLFG